MRRAVLCVVLTAIAGAVLAAPLAAVGPTVTILAVGATSAHRPQGVALGADGAVWFTNEDSDAIGRIAADGAIRLFTSQTVRSPQVITAGPDGALWFSNGADSIGRITTAGAINVFSVPGAGTPNAITDGPDGALWFTTGGKRIGRVTTDAVATFFSDPLMRGTDGITRGPDGAVWFTNYLGASIGRISVDGDVSIFSDRRIRFPVGIVTGPDGALWFADDSGSIGRMTTDGSVTVFGNPSTVGHPDWITVGPDGALWATDRNGSIIRVTTSGSITRYADPSIAFPVGITAGQRGTVWFANYLGDTIGQARIATALTIAERGMRLAGSSVLVRLSGSGETGAVVTATVRDAATERPVQASAARTRIGIGGSFTLVVTMRRTDVRKGRLYQVVLRAGSQIAQVSFRG